MSNNKVVLAYCKKTNKKFCVEVTNKTSGYEVVNFVDLSDSDYSKLTSEITVKDMVSASNLLPCKYCQSRRVSKCSCNRKRKQCGKSEKYDFQCLYCDQLIFDSPEKKRQKIYVTSACYDDIGEVLRSMNISFEQFSGKFDCDILFINCGTSDIINSKELTSFVERGGCLYASDLASRYIQASFPGLITYSDTGEACKIKADVIDPELLQITGKQLDIEFDLGSWSVLSHTQGKVLLRASTGNRYAGKPIMISFSYGKGEVFYTSFHNHSQATSKEKMLLQLLLLKQIGTTTNQSIEQVGNLVGLNISSMKEQFKRLN